MIAINVPFVFGDGAADEIIITTTRAMGKAILDAFGDGVSFYSAGVLVEPTEEQSEAIEAGTYHVTSALNE